MSGISEEDPLAEACGNVFSDTMLVRSEYGLPKGLIVIQPNEDAPYCLNLRTLSKQELAEVVCYELHSRSAEKIAATFEQWLHEWLTQRSG